MHALIPRLGLWDGDAAADVIPSDGSFDGSLDGRAVQAALQLTIPYDYDELISAIAPRPCLLYTQTNDRDANFSNVKAVVATAARAWAAKGAPGMLVHQAPNSSTAMGKNESQALIKWLNGLFPRQRQ
jgi:hypothetical protein